MPKHSSHILNMARKGAEHRYQELNAEIELLVKHFPHVRGLSGNRLASPIETVKHVVRRRKPMFGCCPESCECPDEEILGGETEGEEGVRRG
jgi:hypothetical protein